MNIVDEKQTKNQNILKWLAYGAVAFLALVTALFLYWLYQPSNVLELKETPVPVRTVPPNGDNGIVILHVKYCKNVEVDGRVRISFVSKSREVFLPVSTDRQPARCLDNELPILIPSELPADTYKIHFRVDYQVNPIKNQLVEFDSKPFEVVGS
jgi:hypothetical protein